MIFVCYEQSIFANIVDNTRKDYQFIITDTANGNTINKSYQYSAVLQIAP